MNNIVGLIPALPFLGFLTLFLAGRRLSSTMIAVIGAGSVSIAALLTIILGVQFLQTPPPGDAYTQTLWHWFHIADFSSSITFRLDTMSLAFVFVITFVGALIHLYSVAFMQHDRDYARFFASMNLFVCSMLVLVMADNLLLLYLGWEGVGLCSYLLIGFWYETPANNRAANKAFYLTRIGDTAMAVGLFLLVREFGTLNIRDILTQAPDHFNTASPTITAIALLLLAGGIGKSAQLPLQTWLPDAMAGPSPVSALIHAATMVTAGVYLVARMHVVFQLAPFAMDATAIIGALTLLIAGCSATVQTDIKRILAYSTMSQIGYMFLALGVGAWTAAIFHFFTHAFFKALLFLAAGAVIESLHHEHNIFRMGGLKTRMPLVYWTFLAGAATLAALPFITSGFFSKDQILWYSWTSSNGNPMLWLIALIGAFITAFYTTRLIVVVFYGEPKTRVGALPNGLMTVPLLVLAIPSLTVGFIEWPHNMIHLTLFSNVLERTLPATVITEIAIPEFIVQLIAIVTTFGGIYLGYLLYYRNQSIVEGWKQSPVLMSIRNFLLEGWRFDQLYHVLFVKPFVFLANINKSDVFDHLNKGVAFGSRRLNQWFSLTQNGSLRWYLAGVMFGVLFILTLQLLL